MKLEFSERHKVVSKL